MSIGWVWKRHFPSFTSTIHWKPNLFTHSLPHWMWLSVSGLDMYDGRVLGYHPFFLIQRSNTSAHWGCPLHYSHETTGKGESGMGFFPGCHSLWDSKVLSCLIPKWGWQQPFVIGRTCHLSHDICTVIISHSFSKSHFSEFTHFLALSVPSSFKQIVDTGNYLITKIKTLQLIDHLIFDSKSDRDLNKRVKACGLETLMRVTRSSVGDMPFIKFLLEFKNLS
jgi:hypothetical protein